MWIELGCLDAYGWGRPCHGVGYILLLIEQLRDGGLHILAKCQILLGQLLLLGGYSFPELHLLLLLVSIDYLRLGYGPRRNRLRNNIFSQLLLLLLLHCRSQRHLIMNLQLLCFLIHLLLIANLTNTNTCTSPIMPIPIKTTPITLHWQSLNQLLILVDLAPACIIESRATST
jgi:hypothetical protein